jgi:hypothetical protein
VILRLQFAVPFCPIRTPNLNGLRSKTYFVDLGLGAWDPRGVSEALPSLMGLPEVTPSINVQLPCSWR